MIHAIELRRSILMRQAEQLLRDESLLKLPVDLTALARTRDIVIQPINGPGGGVSGMLVRCGNNFGILYDISIPNHGFRCFSIAHELGHFFIDGHLDYIPFDGKVHQSHANFISNDRYEREADYFAAGLLMPTSLMRGVIQRTSDGMKAIEAIQRCARSSLTASAIRYVGLAELGTAVVVVRNEHIDYCFMSESLRSLQGLSWPRKGAPVPCGTATASIAKAPDKIRRRARDVGETDLAKWFGGRRYIRAQEEVAGLGNYGRVLTVLTCHDLPDNDFVGDDEESDEAVAERWTPRFRR